MKTPKNFFYKDNRLQQLRGFIATIKEGSISNAAVSMGLSQSTVSVQIKTLEEDLGEKLFNRVGRNVVLTEKGKMLYDIVIDHIQAIEGIEEVFANLKNRKYSKVLRVGANNASLNFILPKLLKKYIKKYDDVSLEIVFTEFDEGIKKLAENKIDILLLPRREHKPVPSSINYIPLFYFDPVLLTRKDHPLAGKKKISIKDIAKYDFTLPAKGLHVIPNLHEVFSTYSINKDFRIKFEDWEVTRKFIEADLVISITADIVIEDNDKLVGTSLKHIFPRVDYGFYLPKGKFIPDKIKNLIEIAESFEGNIR